MIPMNAVVMRAVLWTAFLVPIGASLAGAADSNTFGANKFDLLLQYTGFASRGDGSPAYLRITRAMGEKAIGDARRAGFAFLRISATGYAPATATDRGPTSLHLWQSDPDTYWRLADRMFDDLDRAGLKLVPSFLWNLTQFPALTNETVGALITNPNSVSRALAARFVTEFIARYRNRPTILFYEMGNEIDLEADRDLNKHCLERNPPPKPGDCSVQDRFTTEQMIAFSRDIVTLIKSVDPAHLVSSGYDLPRPRAFHLAQRPEFAPQGPDRTIDTVEQLQSYVARIHEPFDIVSLHVYPDWGSRFGKGPGHEAETVEVVAAVAKAMHKPLFLGEFGDKSGAGPFLQSMARLIADGTAAYGAVWVWEFYQTATYLTFNSKPTESNLEPGYSEDVLALFAKASLLPSGSQNRSAERPAVVLTWPLPCSTVNKPTELHAVASGRGAPLDRVEFLSDGNLLGTAKSLPYHVRFDPIALGSRNVIITAHAVDTAGLSSNFDSTIRINSSSAPCPMADD